MNKAQWNNEQWKMNNSYQLAMTNDQWTMYEQWTMYNEQRTMHNVQCTMYNEQSIMNNVQCTVNNVQCTMYSEQCTVNNVHTVNNDNVQC